MKGTPVRKIRVKQNSAIDLMLLNFFPRFEGGKTYPGIITTTLRGSKRCKLIQKYLRKRGIMHLLYGVAHLVYWRKRTTLIPSHILLGMVLLAHLPVDHRIGTDSTRYEGKRRE